ncbi:MAG: DUF7024 domain-containing protein [Roseiflexaceae bacterium]
MMQSPPMYATNPFTLSVLWVVTRIVSVPQYVFILLYMLATSLTAIVTFVVARITSVNRTWAIVVASAFTLAPARFWFVDISDHWWFAVPLVWLVVHFWWYQPLGNWQVMYRITGPLMVIGLLGWDYVLWSSMALMSAAVIAAGTRPEWSWRQLAYAMIPMGVMTLVVSVIAPTPWPSSQGDGLRLLDLAVPHRTHWIPWLAGLGERLAQLEIPRTSTVYGGLLTIVGLMLMVIRAIRQLMVPSLGTAQPLFVWLLSLVLLASMNGFVLLVAWMGVPVVSPQLVQLMVVFGSMILLVQWLQHHQQYTMYAVAIVCLVMLIDQVPATNIMYHMRQNPQEIQPTRFADGVWFGQKRLPADVVAVSGLSTIDPGYGRWSDADVSDRIRIELRNPLTVPVTLEIRARGVGVNFGVPIVVRIGSEEQTMVLDGIVKPHLLTFNQPQGTVIEIIPQPVESPPPGDIRRIGIFLQSIRVVTP